jgi:hypothetical protein
VSNRAVKVPAHRNPDYLAKARDGFVKSMLDFVADRSVRSRKILMQLIYSGQRQAFGAGDHRASKRLAQRQPRRLQSRTIVAART